LDNIVIDLNNGKFIGRLYMPKDFPGASFLDALDVRDYVDWFNSKILVNEVEKRVYIIYPFLKERISSVVLDNTIGIGGIMKFVGEMAGLNSKIPIPNIPLDWSTRHELLAIYDAASEELINSILFDGITEICIDSVNSKVYWYVPLANRIYVLDKNGEMLESILIAKPSNPNDIFTNSNVQLSIEDIPFFDEYPLHNKNKRYGFQFSSKYNKIYLTVEGKSKDFLAIFNLIDTN
jgi:hypothetical protein